MTDTQEAMREELAQFIKDNPNYTLLELWKAAAAQSAEKMARLEEERDGHKAGEDLHFKLAAAAELSNKQKHDALLAAQEFIRNGVEFGYITMPDSSDPALETPNKIAEALAQQPSTEALDAYVAKLIPPGWKVVPVEPTIEMTNAAHDAEHCGNSEPHFANAWMAMLNAAPLPPTSEKGD